MVFAPDGRTRYVNASCADILGRSCDALVGRDAAALAAEGLDPVFIAALSDAVLRATTYRRTQRFLAVLGANAEAAPYEFVATPDRPHDGSEGGVVVVGKDMSALEAAHERWRRTAEHLGMVASSSGAAFCEFDRDSKVLNANALENLCTIAGRDLPMRLDQAHTRGQARVWESIDTRELDDAGRPVAVAVVSREVTNLERLRAERARLIAALPDSVLEHDASGHCQFAHVPAGQLAPFATPAWSVPGATLAEVLGRELAALVDAARARSSGAVETFGYHMPAALGDEAGRDLEVRVAPREDGGTVTILRDVTSERRLEARLVLCDRLASLGRVAAGIAHELNNPLTFLAANVELALEAADRDDPILPMLLDIREGAQRIRAITDDIRVLSRPETQAAPTADIGEVVRSAVRMMGAAVRRRARLVVEVPPLGRVRGPMARLVQVVTNLVGNAVQAFAESDLDRHVVAIRAAAVGDHVELTVEDNGSGIAAETLARVFEPFFTTKDSDGMGLGLPISQGIVAEIGGTLTLDSEVGRGTIARVTLPLATA